MLTHEFVSIAITEMQDLRDLAESHRRERASMPTSPMPGMVDYASAGVALDNGWAHMNESIVHGQKLRTEAAAELVTLGLYHTLGWLSATGYKVPTLLWHWGDAGEISSVTDELTVEQHNAEVLDAMAAKHNARAAAMERVGEVQPKTAATHSVYADGALVGETRDFTYDPLKDPSEDDIAAYTAVHGISFSTSSENPAHVALAHLESELRVTCDTYPTAKENFRYARDALFNGLEESGWKRTETYDPLKDPTSDGYAKVNLEPLVKRSDVTVEYIIPPDSLTVQSHSGVKLTHNPTKLWVESYKSRSAHANVAEGFRMLEKLLANPPASDAHYEPPQPDAVGGFGTLQVNVRTEPEDIEAKLHNFAILATDAIALLVNELKARYNSVKHPELDATLEAIKDLKL